MSLQVCHHHPATFVAQHVPGTNRLPQVGLWTCITLHNLDAGITFINAFDPKLLPISSLMMLTSIVSEFAAYVMGNDAFVGRCKLINHACFRPGNHGNYLSSKTDLSCLLLWTVGCVSSGDLFVFLNGSFNASYTNGSVEEKIAGVHFCLCLVDPEHPELLPIFADSVLGLKTIQALYTGKEAKNLLDSNGGYDQIQLSAKMFEKVSNLSRLTMPLLTLSKVMDSNDPGPGVVYFPLNPFNNYPFYSTGKLSWLLSEELSDLVSSSAKIWKIIPFAPLFVLWGHPGCARFLHTVISPS